MPKCIAWDAMYPEQIQASAEPLTLWLTAERQPFVALTSPSTIGQHLCGAACVGGPAQRQAAAPNPQEASCECHTAASASMPAQPALQSGLAAQCTACASHEHGVLVSPSRGAWSQAPVPRLQRPADPPPCLLTPALPAACPAGVPQHSRTHQHQLLRVCQGPPGSPPQERRW
jgi:hypothetical protein